MTPPATDPTNVDPAANGWAIDDPVMRLRVLGSERVFDLAASDRWLLGSSSGCSLCLDDPTGQTSRRHAVAAELERLLEAYGSDAAAELGASWLGFQVGDPARVLAGGITTLDEIEEVARRLVALRNRGVTYGAKRLGITHGALSRWASRREILT